MNRDRMPDLLKLAETDPSVYNEPEVQKEVPMESGLAIMFKRVGKAVKFLSQMKEILRELQRLHDKLLLSASYAQEQECRDLIERLGNRFGSLARKTRSVLKRFEMDENIMREYAAETSRDNREDQTGIELMSMERPHVTWHTLPSGAIIPLSSHHFIPAEVRMRFHMHNVLAYDLTCVVRQYYIVQKIYGDRCKQKIKRQMEIIGRDIDEAELDEPIGRRESIPLLHSDITDDITIDNEMREKLREVESFHREIFKLEQNIEELHKSFVTISALVYEQGDIINHIENHVMTAADYVENSTELLKKARSFQNKYRKKKCILALSLIHI